MTRSSLLPGAAQQHVKKLYGEATEFIQALTGSPDTAVTWQWFDDKKRGAKVLPGWLHGPLSEHWKTLVEKNQAGAGIFVMVNTGNGKGRAASNVVGLRALFADWDNGPPAHGDLDRCPPSIEVESIRGPHAYWLLREGEPLTVFKSAQKCIAQFFQSDNNVCDLPRVMRVPGFYHHKGESLLVRLKSVRPVRYSAAEVLAHYSTDIVDVAARDARAAEVVRRLLAVARTRLDERERTTLQHVASDGTPRFLIAVPRGTPLGLHMGNHALDFGAEPVEVCLSRTAFCGRNDGIYSDALTGQPVSREEATRLAANIVAIDPRDWNGMAYSVQGQRMHGRCLYEEDVRYVREGGDPPRPLAERGPRTAEIGIPRVPADEHQDQDFDEPAVPLDRRIQRAQLYLDSLCERNREHMHRPENQGKPDPNLVSVSGCDGQRTLMRVACIVVWGFYIPPEAAAEVIRDSNWNHACCHPDGSSYPWEMEGNQGLLRKCAEVLAPGTMLDEKRKPRGYLLAEQPEPEVEASQELPQGCALVPGLKPRDVDKPWQKDWTFDDRGNATRLAAYFGGGLIHVEHLGWHAWDGARWKHSEVTARYCAMQSAERISEEAYHRETLASSAETFKNQTGEQADKARALKAKARAFSKWANESCDDSRIASCLRVASSLPVFSRSAQALDQDPYLLACRNGYLDLRTMGFFPADPRRLVTKLAATDYDPQAECPHWLARLEEWLPEEDKRRYIQEWAGLSLTGDASQHALLLLYGRGRNGKGMIVNTIGDMLGDYCVTIDTEVLIAGERRLSGNAIQEQKFNMRGARMMRPSETAENGKVSSKDLKSLASTDMIRGRLLRQNSVEFRMSGKLWIPINHRPEISDTTDSIWERLKVIEFTKRFLGDKRIPEEEIKAQLRPEWPGILNWALVGLRRIMRVAPDGSVRIQISDPAFLRQAVQEYREEMDTVGQWLAECTSTEDPSATAAPAAIMDSYVWWCDMQSIPGRERLGRNKLLEEVRSRGKHARDGYRRFVGLQITSGPVSMSFD